MLVQICSTSTAEIQGPDADFCCGNTHWRGGGVNHLPKIYICHCILTYTPKEVIEARPFDGCNSTPDIRYDKMLRSGSQTLFNCLIALLLEYYTEDNIYKSNTTYKANSEINVLKKNVGAGKLALALRRS